MSKWQDQRKVVTDEQAQKIADAPLFALRNGQWFNRYITINFHVAELDRSAALSLFQDQKEAHPRLACHKATLAHFASCRSPSKIWATAALLTTTMSTRYGSMCPLGFGPIARRPEARWLMDGLDKYHGVPHPAVLVDKFPIERHYEAFLAHSQVWGPSATISTICSGWSCTSSKARSNLTRMPSSA